MKVSLILSSLILVAMKVSPLRVLICILTKYFSLKTNSWALFGLIVTVSIDAERY